MPNHKFYFDANLIHFFGILKYIKNQQRISITICCKKWLFKTHFTKDSIRKFKFKQNYKKNPRIFRKILGLKL